MSTKKNKNKKQKTKNKKQKTKNKKQKTKNKKQMEEVRVEGQNYALISFVSPEGAQKADTLGFRIYGAFDTVETAREHAALVNASDAAFDVYVVEMRKWCAWQ